MMHLQLFPIKNVRGGMLEVNFNIPAEKLEEFIRKVALAIEPVINEYEEFIVE